ncbi:hypothetical protein O181_006815 [Austropuccinia psidii MF-1]|uniref:Uncharacterized protein n=1 Tax=Austropuccinia psidii MF-1 TaxID=1389203 RepID=A0A9Q3BLQ6_9BASI|nr:hypothetical protein [Austropuccinia psidii MF-1]
MSELTEKIPLIILDSSESSSLFVTDHTKYMVELTSFTRFEWDFLVIDTPKGEDIILGFVFLNHFNPSIDWRKGLITFSADQKDYSDHSTSFSNDFSSSKSCAALVGDSRTPSFSSSVHIPSLNSSPSLLSSIDWRKGLITFNADRKDYYHLSKSFSNDFASAKSCEALVGDSTTPSFPSSVHIPSYNSHQSLLSSRDKVVKEIQYVGKLHLFLCNMDLPPSSYNDSLEEFWDEEEDPE